MGFLKCHNHILDRERNMIINYGVEINIKYVSGTTDCPACTYDEQLGTSSNPNCTTCSGRGKVDTYVTNNQKVVPHWFTTEEINPQGAGDIKIGDCRLTSEYKELSNWQNIIQHEVIISVDGISVIPKRVLPSVLKTICYVYCSRTDLT